MRMMAVRCLFGLDSFGRARVKFFHLSYSPEDALQLARAIRETFGAPAWVEEYYHPANVRTIELRAWRDAIGTAKAAAGPPKADDELS